MLKKVSNYVRTTRAGLSALRADKNMKKAATNTQRATHSRSIAYSKLNMRQNVEKNPNYNRTTSNTLGMEYQHYSNKAHRQTNRATRQTNRATRQYNRASRLMGY